jgi:hypothetical protein
VRRLDRSHGVRREGGHPLLPAWTARLRRPTTNEQNPHPAYRTTEVHQTLPSLAVRQRQRRTIERRSPSPRPEEDDC